jgi:hypothetical protein
VLAICPWIPVDVLVVMSGARSRVSVYQTLSRLLASRLVQKRQMLRSVFAGSRPVALWASTTAGTDAHRLRRTPEWKPLRLRDHITDPVRIGAVRALAGWIATQRASGGSLKIVGWQAPFIQQPGLMGRSRLRVSGAALVEMADGAETHLEWIMIVADLATAPIARFRPTLLRLQESSAHVLPDGDSYPVRLLIATTNLDGAGARRHAWLRLVRGLRIDAGASALACDVLDWPQVFQFLGVHVPSHGSARNRLGRGEGSRRRRSDEMLDLVGRHPFLTIKQVADLQGMTQRRARQLRQSLVEQGLVRLLSTSDLGPRAPIRRDGHDVSVVDFMELTAAGRELMARRLGLAVSAARRYHGLFGGSPRHRRRALRQSSIRHTGRRSRCRESSRC